MIKEKVGFIFDKLDNNKTSPLQNDKKSTGSASCIIKIYDELFCQKRNNCSNMILQYYNIINNIFDYITQSLNSNNINLINSGILLCINIKNGK